MNKIIEAIKLSKRFENIEPVKQVDFSIERGEFVTLLGPSGSGKSTLLSLVAGLENPTSGQILLDGQDLSSLTEDDSALLRRENVGFVFQSFHLIPTLSALENIAFPLYPIKMDKGKKRKRARKLLSEVDLGKRADHLPSQLSGGERQRVAIARALVNQPKIIFCDEPTGNLDSSTGKEILDLLIKLNIDEKVTIFMVTHDTNIAKLSHRSLYMNDGEVSRS
jgi:putative ABC transport system ATP-binding protein